MQKTSEQVMTEQLKHDEDWKAAGLFVVNGKAITMVIDTPLLVLDVDAWTKSVIQIFEEQKIESEAANDLEGVEAFSSTVKALKAWLETGVRVLSVFPLSLRQSLPRYVNKRNLQDYLRKVMTFGRLASKDDSLSFYFDVDGGSLYTLPHLKAQAKYSGEIRGEVLNKIQLERKIAEAILKVEGVRLPDRKLSPSIREALCAR